MESFLSVVFPCCFRHRRSYSSSGSHNERTPLLHDASAASALHHGGGGSGSSRHDSLGDLNGTAAGAAAGAGSAAEARRKRRQTSILPTPAYDATVLRGIIEDFRGKLIGVDTAAGGGGGGNGEKGVGLISGCLASEQVAAAQGASPTSGTRYLTPIHTLRLALSPSSSSSPAPPSSPPARLVDIWSHPTPPSRPSTPTTAAPSGKLNYSAAAKRGSTAPTPTPGTTKKPSAHHKRFATASASASSAAAAAVTTATPSPADASHLEQSTYETLAQLASSTPLVHDWDLAEDEAED